MAEDLIWDEIARQISQATGEKFEIGNRQSISGGCINQAYIISNNRQQRYFIKLNQPSLAQMFAAEAQGLQELIATNTITVPKPTCWGATDRHSYLVLEYLDLIDRGTSQNWNELGRNLAAMHRFQITNPPRFGWHINNTIGSTPQLNTWETNWAMFFKNHRIGYQLELAQQQGAHFPKATDLLSAIPQILANHHPQPALVHGDLWSGNASFTRTGSPVIFDPATYWGDREVDLAMTELFSGFPAAFYQGYEHVYPLDPGYFQRKSLYNLYHILNHYNLFGGSDASKLRKPQLCVRQDSYHSQANGIIDSLLR